VAGGSVEKVEVESQDMLGVLVDFRSHCGGSGVCGIICHQNDQVDYIRWRKHWKKSIIMGK
jgi:hypothetical protein